MPKAEASVEDLVSMIERGELRLPEMQRQYVWKSTQVRDLLDSLYRGYPSGAILLWETDESVPLRDFAVHQSSNPYQGNRLLLDGQQRLTSLSAVIRGEPVLVRDKKRPIDLLFNLEHPDHLAVVTEVDENDDVDEDDQEENGGLIDDETDSSEDELLKRFNNMAFVVSTRKLEQLPQWVKVSDVFKADSDAPFLKRAGMAGFDDPRYEKYSQRLAKLRGICKYVYRMDVLERALSYDEVTEIFVRVNSRGTKLRSSDLALAQITAKWRHSLQIFLGFKTECAHEGFDFDMGLHLKNLMAFATGQSRFSTVSNLTVEALQKAWKGACEGMHFALNFLRNNVGIDSPALLSSPFLVVAIAFFGHSRKYTLSNDDERLLRYWVLVSNAKGRFSRGSSETILDQDLATIRDGGTVTNLIDRLRSQFGRLDITADELEARNQRSGLFKTMFLAFRAAEAKDWKSQLVIALDHTGAQHRLQFHHIFPKAVLKGGYTSREANDIANLAFIGGKTNRTITSKPPAAYLPPLIAQLGHGAFAAQAIPVDETLLDIDNYKAFLAERRQQIAASLNQFIGELS
ncbi:MAG: GmrSD restriction endonuclease domain-containing protein [Thermoguttaceae bacterium]